VYVVERFAEFAEGHRRQPVAPRVLHQAKRVVIDWHAALLPGAVVPPATALERALAGELDHGEARLALGKRASVRAAALINGAAAHTLEVDDIFREGIYHPGAPTIAAALAVAQSRRASGEQFLRAVIVGYEISTRIAAAMAALTTSIGTTPAPSAVSARRAPRPSCWASRESASPMRSPQSPLSQPACSRRSARIRCPSPCTRGARRKPA